MVCVFVAQSFPTLYDPMDCSPPGSSVHVGPNRTGVPIKRERDPRVTCAQRKGQMRR